MAKSILRSQGINKEMKDDEIYEWLDDYINPTSLTKIIDKRYFSLYQPQIGFKVVIDGIHNTGGLKLFGGVFYLNPDSKYIKSNG